MSSETYHYPELGNILFGIEKVLNGIALLVCIYILYISLKFKSQKDDLTAIIKRQLVISCIIHIIPYLFPPLKDIEQKEPYDYINPLCGIQVFFGSFSNFCVSIFSTAIPCLTYLRFSGTQISEKNEKIIKLYLPILSWGIPLILSAIFTIVGRKHNEEDYYCWFKDDYIVLIHNIFTVVCLFVIYGLFWKIKYDVKKEINKSGGQIKYMKRLLKYNVLVYTTMILIIIGVISDLFVSQDQKVLYYFFCILKYSMDCLLYPINACIFCLQKITLQEFFDIFGRKEITDEEQKKENSLVNMLMDESKNNRESK